MKKNLLFVSTIGITLSSCTMINETINALEYNRQAVEDSTRAIEENRQAIEQANRGIEENRRQLDAINSTLKKANES
jgi:methyl-accepting chemotaxis protein